jgi:hypothetical protein
MDEPEDPADSPPLLFLDSSENSALADDATGDEPSDSLLSVRYKWLGTLAEVLGFLAPFIVIVTVGEVLYYILFRYESLSLLAKPLDISPGQLVAYIVIAGVFQAFAVKVLADLIALAFGTACKLEENDQQAEGPPSPPSGTRA